MSAGATVDRGRGVVVLGGTEYVVRDGGTLHSGARWAEVSRRARGFDRVVGKVFYGSLSGVSIAPEGRRTDAKEAALHAIAAAWFAEGEARRG